MSQGSIWIIGAGGMLGSELTAVLQTAGVHLVTSDREVDIRSVEALRDFAAVSGPGIGWIINCAAYTAVDKAEDDIELCTQLNAEAPGSIGLVAQKIGASVIHLSTDYVFDGNGIAGADGSPRPYREGDPIGPTGVYGRTKADGEAALQQACSQSVIVRTAWLYGQYGPNFVATMIRLMNDRESIGVVGDQFGSPTWTMDLSRAISAIVQSSQTRYGTYHFSGEGVCSWYDFALEIYDQGRQLGLISSECEIRKLSTSEYPTPASRPAWSVLDKTNIRTDYSIIPPQWQESLQQYLTQLVAKGE